MNNMTNSAPAQESQWVPHSETDGMTAAEMRDAITNAEDRLKRARELGDEGLQSWESQEIRQLEASLSRRSGDDQKGRRESQADILIKLVEDSGAELFHTPT